ncbi:hypothetical protein [uncultured Paludibaculum sp.]|uniref:hypothetical protein n=1 Tax=uncultured Paludibaculum sp. TaxID=1765020 RepID=UPI002AAB80E2|nr:hypothetical protein [uncultured Paludibaculum sp.]
MLEREHGVIVAAPHPRAVGEAGPQNNQFLSELPRAWLRAFEGTERLHTFPPMVGGKERREQDGQRHCGCDPQPLCRDAACPCQAEKQTLQKSSCGDQQHGRVE